MSELGSAQGTAQGREQQLQQLHSTSQLLGALVPSVSLAAVLLSLFLVLRRRLPSVYDPKRRRAQLLLSEEGQRR